MKPILFGILGIALILSISACSDDADPQFRVMNERADKVNLQIQTSGGNTINLNDVQAGQGTAYQSAREGTITATAVIQNEQVTPQISFFAEKGSRSTIVVQAGTTPTMRVDR
jgi:hypothetical protein